MTTRAPPAGRALGGAGSSSSAVKRISTRAPATSPLSQTMQLLRSLSSLSSPLFRAPRRGLAAALQMRAQATGADATMPATALAIASHGEPLDSLQVCSLPIGGPASGECTIQMLLVHDRVTYMTGRHTYPFRTPLGLLTRRLPLTPPTSTQSRGCTRCSRATPQSAATKAWAASSRWAPRCGSAGS